MSKDYTRYSTNDFIADEDFLQWAQFPDAEQDAFWNTWLAAHPEKKETVQAALQFIHAMHFNVNEPTPQQVEQSLLKNLAAIAVQETEKPLTMPMTSARFNKKWWAMAAAVLLLVTAGWLYVQKGPVTIQLVTGDNEIKTVLLPDGSTLVLNANSSVTYAADLASALTREVWLKGEAFFDVEHIETEASKPRRFVVHSGAVNVEVLGTSFNVKNRAAVTNVSLNTGSIRINLTDAPDAPIYLQPGDFMQYSGTDKKVFRKKVKTELYSVWKDSTITLNNMPLKDMMQMIEDVYGYRIKIKDPAIAGYKLSGSLRLNDEQVALKTLSEALEIDILHKDNELILQPKNQR